MGKVHQIKNARNNAPHEVPDEDERIIDLTVGELLELLDARRVPSTPKPYYLSLSDAAPLVGASPPTLRGFIARGMPHAKVGATTKINVAQSIEWIRLHGGE